MNKKELANLLNGREYRKEITDDEIKLAKENWLVVIFWYSDDNIEFNWLINDEIWAWNWCECYLDKKDKKLYYPVSRYIVENELSEDFWDIVQDYFDRNCIKITAKLNNFWEINVEWIEFERFDIIEDWEKFSDGIIINLIN